MNVKCLNKYVKVFNRDKAGYCVNGNASLVAIYCKTSIMFYSTDRSH